MEQRAVSKTGQVYPAISRKFFFGAEGGRELVGLLEQMELSGSALKQIMLATGRSFEALQNDALSEEGIRFSEKLSEIEKDSLRALVALLGHLSDVAPLFVVQPTLDQSVRRYVLGAIEDPEGEFSALVKEAVERVFLRMFDSEGGSAEGSSDS